MQFECMKQKDKEKNIKYMFVIIKKQKYSKMTFFNLFIAEQIYQTLAYQIP